MIIRLAKHSGYCFGVKRAITSALDAANLHQKVFTIGPLIHNPQIVEHLQKLGIEVATEIDKVKDSTVIVRSHGICKEEMQTLQSGKNIIIDATCPYVSRTHEIVSQLVKEGYPVYILGDENHPEVKGIKSYGNQETVVLPPDWTPDGIHRPKLSVLSQTTQKLESLQNLVSSLLPQCNELRVFNTICSATTLRQNATRELAECSDLMVIIGGKNSSNTKMLALLCSQYCETILVETEAEIEPGFFGLAGETDARSTAVPLAVKQKIGLSAGASTPDGMIVSVYNKIKEIYGEKADATSIEAIPIFKEESC